VYEVLLARSLERRGLAVERQKPIRFAYAGLKFDEGFRVDLMVDDRVIVELKSVEELHPSHKKQLKTYLKLADKRLGLLINFGAPLIKDGISRVALNLPEA
jgi:iron complex transport system substrate-binding protein